MIARNALLAAAGAAALAASPAWALPGRGAGPGRPHGTETAPGQTGELPGRAPADSPSQPHRCTPHAVAYVAAGRLVSHTLVQDGAEPTPTVARAARGPSGPTWSGDVTIDVKRTNRHARADKGTTKTYTLDHARVLHFADAVAGSRAKVIGKVTKLAPRCDQTGFTPELTIRKLLLHAPVAPQS
jgi:hypothetical protein